MSLGTVWGSGTWAINAWANGTWADAAAAPEIIDVTVRAFKAGFFVLYRNIDDTFLISTPEQYSPYWMEFVDAVPPTWVSHLAVFHQHIDQEILEF